MKHFSIAQRSPKGFTLIELLVIVALVSVLGKFAMGSYSEYLQSKRQDEAKSLILEVMQKQNLYKTNSPYEYTTDLTNLGYSSAANIKSREVDADGDGTSSHRFTVSAVVCDHPPPMNDLKFCVKVVATPVNATIDSTWSLRSNESSNAAWAAIP